MKTKPPGIPWLLVLLLGFVVIVFISWLVYRYNMNVLIRQEK